MKKIPLTQGKFALVDDEDFDEVSKYKWYPTKTDGQENYRAATHKNNKTILMHRLIMDAPSNLMVDHINHDGLDNRKENLRLCTRSENNFNQRKRIDCKSGYKGVREIRKGNYKMKITVKGKIIEKYFSTILEAAEEYNRLAKKYFGEFACLNKIK